MSFAYVDGFTLKDTGKGYAIGNRALSSIGIPYFGKLLKIALVEYLYLEKLAFWMIRKQDRYLFSFFLL